MSDDRELCAIETSNLKTVQDYRLEFYATPECSGLMGGIGYRFKKTFWL
jgi:hypothetical protein